MTRPTRSTRQAHHRPALGLAALLAGAGLVTGACSTSTPAHDSSAQGHHPARSAPATPARLRVRTVPWRLPRPLAREAAVPQADGHHVVVAGGLLDGDVTTGTSYEVDVRHGRVRHLPDLPVPVHDTAGVRLGGRTLVLGGGNSSEQGVVQQAGPAAWRVTGHLPRARSDLTAVVAGGRAWILGGYDGTSPALGEILAGDGRGWHPAGTLPVPVRYPATTVMDGAAWIIGGEVGGHMVDTVQRVDLTTGRTRVVGRLPRRVGHAVAVGLGGRILVAGGRLASDTVLPRMWWVDPRTGAVRPAGRLPRPLADSAVVRTGPQEAYLLGGESPHDTDRVVRLAWR